jgi:hypothetical protein
MKGDSHERNGHLINRLVLLTGFAYTDWMDLTDGQWNVLSKHLPQDPVRADRRWSVLGVIAGQF